MQASCSLQRWMIFTPKGKRNFQKTLLNHQKDNRGKKPENKGGNFLKNFKDDIKVSTFLPTGCVKRLYLINT